MEGKFRKGLQSLPDGLYDELVESIQAGQSAKINKIISRSGLANAPVYANIFDISQWNCPDIEIFKKFKEDGDRAFGYFDYYNVEFERELDFLYELADLRDVPFADIDAPLPDGLTKLSWFHRNLRVRNFHNVDYLADGVVNGVNQRQEYERIHAGLPKSKSQVQQASKTKKVETGRDLASYVYNDNAMDRWQGVIKDLLSRRVRDMGIETEWSRRGTRSPFENGLELTALVGVAMQRVSKLSFRIKWYYMQQRPEELACILGKMLPQAYAIGSPFHPSFIAMHTIIDAVLVELFKLAFASSSLDELPSGRTLAYELDLMADNNGLARLWAGVHYESDHTFCRDISKQIANKIWNEYTAQWRL